VGRGTNAFEYAFYHVEYDQAEAIFADALNCLIEGLTHERLTYTGPHYQYNDVPLPLTAVQRPYPPLWFGSTTGRSATWAGENGLQFVTTTGTDDAGQILARYGEALAKRGGPAVWNGAFPGGAAKGIAREVVVADTDAEAYRIAKPAHDHLYRNQTYLRTQHHEGHFRDLDVTVRPTHRAGDLDAALREGEAIAGSPETVRNAIAEQLAATGANYFVGYFMFGTMTLADALHSFDLFTTEVKPHFETAPLPLPS